MRRSYCESLCSQRGSWPLSLSRSQGRFGVPKDSTQTDSLQTLWKGGIMSGQAEELKRKLEEMLASRDTEWADAVAMTLNALYRQFELRRECDHMTTPVDLDRMRKRRLAFQRPTLRPLRAGK
jgi:hypothetical protein